MDKLVVEGKLDDRGEGVPDNDGACNGGAFLVASLVLGVVLDDVLAGFGVGDLVVGGGEGGLGEASVLDLEATNSAEVVVGGFTGSGEVAGSKVSLGSNRDVGRLGHLHAEVNAGALGVAVRDDTKASRNTVEGLLGAHVTPNLNAIESLLGVDEGGDVVVAIGGSSELILDLRATAAGEEGVLGVDGVAISGDGNNTVKGVGGGGTSILVVETSFELNVGSTM